MLVTALGDADHARYLPKSLPDHVPLHWWVRQRLRPDFSGSVQEAGGVLTFFIPAKAS